jgi:hypothetical protein
MVGSTDRVSSVLHRKQYCSVQELRVLSPSKERKADGDDNRQSNLPCGWALARRRRSSPDVKSCFVFVGEMNSKANGGFQVLSANVGFYAEFSYSHCLVFIALDLSSTSTTALLAHSLSLSL